MGDKELSKLAEMRFHEIINDPGKHGGNELNGFMIDKGKKIIEKCLSPFQSQSFLISCQILHLPKIVGATVLVHKDK